jgi:hypothetical protein
MGQQRPQRSMKQPGRDTIDLTALAVERAIDAAVRQDFDADSCLGLTLRLADLFQLVLEEGEFLPIKLEDPDAPLTKVLMMADIAYTCWLNDKAAEPLPDAVMRNYVARMKRNPQHCKLTLDLARHFLTKHGKLLSSRTGSLLIP